MGYLSHAQVLQQYNETDLLLLLLFNSKSGVGNYPGKIFEYFAAEKPIIAFGPEGSDVENLLFDYYRGVCPSYDTSVKDIKFHVLTYYKMRNSIMFIKDASKFSRKKLTHDLANLLNTLS